MASTFPVVASTSPVPTNNICGRTSLSASVDASTLAPDGCGHVVPSEHPHKPIRHGVTVGGSGVLGLDEPAPVRHHQLGLPFTFVPALSDNDVESLDRLCH